MKTDDLNVAKIRYVDESQVAVYQNGTWTKETRLSHTRAPSGEPMGAPAAA